MELTDRIRKLRLAKGYTQEYMAMQLGMSDGNYSNMELGKTKISVEWLTKIAGVFGLKLSELLDEATTFNEEGMIYQKSDSMQLLLLTLQVQSLRQEVEELRKEMARLRK